MQKLILIFLTILMVSTLTGLSCGLGLKKTETQSTPTASPTAATDTELPTSNLTNVEGTSIDDMITTNYNLAKAKVAEWHTDAVLANLTIKFPKNLATGQANETYIFGSASDAKNWWSFSISEQSSKYIRAIIPKEDYLGTDVKPINTTYWKMNYLKAFQLAEANGGKTFRDENKNTEVIATLNHSQPQGWLWWQIEYKSTTTGKSLIIKVNPNDGNVVDEEGNPLSTTTSTTAK